MSKPRSIFEEVSEQEKPSTPTPGGIDRAPKGARRGIRLWLMVIFLMVAAMVVIGGLTRLTDSGLSITEWKPVTGAVPPMSAEAWDGEFQKYRETPQYEALNRGMELAEFKFIYWWEWGHRQLGRTVGLVWALGFLGFLATKNIPTGWTGRLLLLGALGGLQGAIGWWMVASGLKDGMIAVASYRLAVHLGLAFLILGFLGWYILLLGRSEAELLKARRDREGKLFSMSTGLMHFSMVQILIGALVAGIDAGRTFTDWPLMAGGFFPIGMFELTPFWTNFFENPGLVQFMHRIVGYLLLIFTFIVWRKSRASGKLAVRRGFDLVLGMMVLQAVLGVLTVWNAAPLSIAIQHQIGAIILWVLILRARFMTQYPPEQTIRRA
ncbi:COX15/CtaA family protein [Halocynthiibacter sp. C4]|uniref:heme A synthase n=1 Tax=Halocynthiibacter sp. C4 TaxID=2992758 RepID=UPI00237B4D93|nr:heme A synthase [Halocynthiibacter sp. C4]MDE0589669.1 COX15/CtaA family protein [Halocynthiibacter sp. C4]